MDDLKDKVVLITGASSGIGAAAALAFAQQRASVAVHFRSHEQEANDIVKQIKAAGGFAAPFQADAMDTDSLDRLANDVNRHFGRIDVLVNNAGGMVQRALLSQAEDALIDEVFHLNARSMIALNRSVVPYMLKQGGGNIINITSQAARSGGSPGSGLYAASKAYVSTYTRGLARELVRYGIRVNAVSPGVIDTPIHDAHTSAELMDKLKKSIPMRRLGRADECAGVILFLASEYLSSYVIGQVIEVNGGTAMP
jgi:3-oxoacyl-[acyl-carrier protein] reductase